MTNKIALIDMDGTLADYDSALIRDMELIRSPHEPQDFIPHTEIPHLKARAKMIRSRPGWWLELEPLKAGFDIVKILREQEFKLHILTKAPNAVDAAWTEKVMWCKKHIPDADVTITQNKGLVYGKILVDDWLPYVSDWLEHRHRGLVIMPAQRWNADYKELKFAKQIVRYDGTNLDEVEARVKKVVEQEEARIAALEYGDFS